MKIHLTYTVNVVLHAEEKKDATAMLEASRLFMEDVRRVAATQFDSFSDRAPLYAVQFVEGKVLPDRREP